MNKQDYKKMSDFEINQSIAKKLGLNVSKEQWLNLGDRDENLVIIDTTAIEGYKVNSTFEVVNYCNNWSDIGPLIEANNICLIPPYCDDKADVLWDARSDITEESCESMYFTHSVVHKNPLRAAAIVWLLMQEDRK